MAHPQARLGATTNLQAMHRQGEPSKTSASPTFEQLLRAGEATRWSAPARSSQILGKQHYMEDDHIIHTPPRKSTSVLAKVKEKAKKWRNSLSRKKHSVDGNATPSWGVSLDEEDEDEDPEYLGAPMYESEMAPEGYKETARKHPRAISFIPENHVYASNIISSKNVHNSTNFLAESMFQTPDLSPIKTQKSLDRTPKSAPAIVSLSPIMVSSHPPMPSPHAHAVIAPSLPTIGTKQGELSPEEFCKVSPSSAPAKVATSCQHSTSKQLWGKGVSVKEYIMEKLKPGEDEKALSQVISDAISPRKTPSDATVVEKVKEAVSSLLLNQESPSSRTAYHSAQNSSIHFPISTNAHEVVEEENTLGRILQYN